MSVEVLKNDGIEGRELVGEELIDGEGDERELVLRGARVVGHRTEDEERDDVDRCIALEPLPERGHVVGGSAGDMKDAHVLARDGEGDEPSIVLRNRVAGRGTDGNLDDARRRAPE